MPFNSRMNCQPSFLMGTDCRSPWLVELAHQLYGARLSSQLMGCRGTLVPQVRRKRRTNRRYCGSPCGDAYSFRQAFVDLPQLAPTPHRLHKYDRPPPDRSRPCPRPRSRRTARVRYRDISTFLTPSARPHRLTAKRDVERMRVTWHSRGSSWRCRLLFIVRVLIGESLCEPPPIGNGNRELIALHIVSLLD